MRLLFVASLLTFCVAGNSTGQSITGSPVECDAGFAGVYPCENVDLLSYLALSDLGSGTIDTNDIWGWTDHTTGKEYAIVGRRGATSFVDVTDPVNPVLLGVLPLTSGANPSSWRDMKVFANHVFIVADGSGNHGMQVLDLTQLRNVTNPPETFVETAIYTQVASAHNIAINKETGFAYIVGTQSGAQTCGGGLHMVDISSPASPSFAGCFTDGNTPRTLGSGAGYSHDVQCVIYDGPDTEHQGKEICFGSNESGLSIADVTNKAAPSGLGAGILPTASYLHQGWLTEDHEYFYQNDELNELNAQNAGTPINTTTYVWDVTDLDDPQMVNVISGNTTSIDHNLYVVGNYMLQTNYTAGLRVWDITNRINPTEIGFFDIAPSNNDVGFGGAWGSYPFFESGNIVVNVGLGNSAIPGLYVLRATSTNLANEPLDAPGKGSIRADVYPNPASRVITAQIHSRQNEQVTVDVMDLLGRHVTTLFSGVSQAGAPVEVSANVIDWPRGLYILRVSSDDRVVTSTFVVG